MAVSQWRAALSRLLYSLCRALVRWDQRWLRYCWLRYALLRLERCTPAPACLPPRTAGPEGLLEAAYCIRQVLADYAGLEDVPVGLEAGHVVLLVRQPLPQELQGRLEGLLHGAIEVRFAAELPVCRSLDGDHCNSDYDRS